MRSGLRAVAASQHGLFLRRQALSAGCTSREFDALTRPGGSWVRVRYGVYFENDLWRQLTPAQQLILRDHAALLVCAEDAVLSHTSSARVQGLSVYDVDDGLSHLTRDRQGRSSRVQAQVKHHLAELDPCHIVEVDGARVTDPLRTAMDMSREYGYRSGLVTADSALAAGADPQELILRAQALGSEPRAPTIRAVARFADGRAQTPIETLGRILLHDMGITDLEPQYVIRFPNGRHADGDLYSPSLNHLFECDGKLKYQDQLNDRGELVTAQKVIWLEKVREDYVRGLGIGVSRIYWSDTLPQNFARASARLWREVKLQSGRGVWLPGGA
ncbi:MAG: hypothetical protein M3Q82_05160 [Actinomycetota bacterium]|nr:hypothetical protein [Actinomycetota bacterium]